MSRPVTTVLAATLLVSTLGARAVMADAADPPTGAEPSERIVITPPGCPNDIDGNGFVDFADIFEIILHLGPCLDCREDLDASGNVDFGDILQVIITWGPCPPVLGDKELSPVI